MYVYKGHLHIDAPVMNLNVYSGMYNVFRMNKKACSKLISTHQCDVMS